MANYSRVTETVERIRFELDTPANLIELDKLVRAAAQDYCLAHGLEWSGMSDDAITVSVEDSTIVAWWEVQLKGESKKL